MGRVGTGQDRMGQFGIGQDRSGRDGSVRTVSPRVPTTMEQPVWSCLSTVCWPCIDRLLPRIDRLLLQR